MGLDMWLYKRGHRVHDESTGATYTEDPVELGYWRKFNALHGFILNITESTGNTNCEPIYLTRGDILTVFETLKRVRYILDNGTKEYSDDANASEWTYDEDTTAQACELLPPVEGFFFGRQEIDDYYYDCVVKSIDIFQTALQEIDLGEDIYYDCWW